MKKIPLGLVLICIAALFLRLWQAPEFFYFTMDEAIIAFRGWGLFELGRTFIIGGISPLGVHHPPYFYWLSAVFLPLSNYSPLIWSFLALIPALGTIILLYYLGKKFGGIRLGAVSAIVYTFSLTAILFDRHYWPLVFNPFFAVSTLWLLISKYKRKWLYLSLLMVLAVTADPSNLVLLLLVLFGLFKQKTKTKSKLVFAVCFLFIFLAPLVLFDLRHNGSNISGVQKFIAKAGENQPNLQSFQNAFLLPPRTLSLFWYTNQTNIAFFHTYCPTYSNDRQLEQSVVLVLLALLLLVIYSIKKSKTATGEQYFAFLLLFYWLGLLVYGSLAGRPLFDHYLAGLLPVFAFITAKTFTRFWVIGFFLTVIFVCLNLAQFMNLSNPYGLKAIKSAVEWSAGQLGNQEFALDVNSNCFRYNGTRYLYEINNTPPAISFIDPQFFWLYRKLPADYFPQKVVLFSDTKDKPDLPILSQKNFGAWDVYILDNLKKDYKIEGM